MPSLRPVASSRPTLRGLAALAIAVLLGFAPGAAAPALAGPASVEPATPEPATEAVTVEGTYELAVEDPHGDEHHDGEAHAGPSVEGELETVPLLAVDDAVYELPEGAGDGVEPGSDVTLTLDVPVESAVEDVLEDLATAEAAVLDLVPTPTVGAESVEPGTAAAVTGLHTLTVLPVYWTQPDGTTPAALRTLAAETAAYWSEQSAGRITVQSDVRDWARIPAPVGCASARVFSDALAAHPGVASGSNQHVAVYFPRYAACPWAGLATLRGSMILLNGVPWLDVLAHELGHNLGLGHANRAVCTADGQRVPLSGSCTNEEYLDYADVMGIGMGGRPTGSLNSALATSLGLVDVRTAGTTATVVDLAPLGGAQGVRALRIPVGLGELFVDFRPAVGRDTRYSAWAGVQVHLRKVDSQGIPTSQLLDLQPAAGTFVTPQLGSAGWEVPGTGRTLRITALDAGRARVELTGQGDVVPGPTPAPPAPTAVTGAVVVTGGGGPVRDAVLQVRNASCSTVFSTMRTGADGTFPVTAYPGQYCLVPVSVPAPFALPGSQVFTVGSSGFSVPVALVGPSTGSVVVTGGGAP
ncbi:hypothetical protein AB6N24_09410, partial [Cellulomonas sp. 179-A 4D5 NHS]|uniref:hypothetical protein n=1 Tax=Cellulomonas sp. 179-A 4D5 NHS TaxID=3142378 RepID=UPI0039A33C37